MKLRHSAPFELSDAERFLATLPLEPAVFTLWPEPDPSPGTQPYVGRTRNLRHRLARLLASPSAGWRLNLREFTRRIDYERVGSSFETAWMIYQLNRAYYPRAYRQRLRLKPPVLLKVSLRNRFPRCYPTRRLAPDGSLYYGPFPSRTEAERFAAEFLDFFKIRRCVEDLHPDPSHPGCIYSQMRMCLAPCYAGCTDDEYRHELGRVVAFLDTEGRSLESELGAERGQASEALDFEQAAHVHRRMEKLNEVLRRRPALARNLADLHALILQRGAEPKSVVFFRVRAGELRGPVTLSLDERVALPLPLDEQIHTVLRSLSRPNDEGIRGGEPAFARPPDASMLPGARQPAFTTGDDAPTLNAQATPLPPWEHLALLARWYYSSFREGALVLLGRDQEIPHARLIRICRQLTAA